MDKIPNNNNKVDKISRRLAPVVKEDLKKKMVFIAGPRQCGKTTLAKSLIPSVSDTKAYYNWDIDSDRKLLLHNQLNPESKLWVFDEVHKNRRWRNWLKGIYDEHHEDHRILITGSARLDLYSRGGDSLQGRYYAHHLHPITLSEFAGVPFSPDSLIQFQSEAHSTNSHHQKLLSDLLILSGFPEPLFSGSKVESDRWRLNYGARLVREEVTSLEQVQDLARMELLYEYLSKTVGSVLSMNSLREDLEVSFSTVKNWIEIFERLYGVFRIYPFGPHKIKAVKKEAKLYFWDWGQASTESAQFENLVAVHLLRWVHWMQDVLGQKYELRYFRTTVGHEVDFIVLKDGKPFIAIEVKVDDRPLDAGIKYLLERMKIPNAFQISLNGKLDYFGPALKGGRVRFLPAAKLLLQLP